MIFDFVLLAHFRISAAGGFPSAAVKALGLCVQTFFTTKTHTKSLQTAGGQSTSLIPLCFQLQFPEHPKSSSTVSSARQCFVNHLRKIEWIFYKVKGIISSNSSWNRYLHFATKHCIFRSSSDHFSCYKLFWWRDTCEAHQAHVKHTFPSVTLSFGFCPCNIHFHYFL